MKSPNDELDNQLNRKTWPTYRLHRSTDWPTNQLTNKVIDLVIKRITDKPKRNTDWNTFRPTNQLTIKLSYKHTFPGQICGISRLAASLAEWWSDWFTDWLASYLLRSRCRKRFAFVCCYFFLLFYFLLLSVSLFLPLCVMWGWSWATAS